MTSDERATALLERLHAGDTNALEPLMDWFAGRLYRVARGITHNELDAEEVVQDVFVALLRQLRASGGVGHLALSHRREPRPQQATRQAR
jgi:DNA-directed RNA polymerase specialized sigma24 family protein